jgi:AcrR family transcriptional regulator
MPAVPKGPAWTRLEDEPPSRPRITRDQIVDVAIALADAEGLEAVSIRRVAAALETRPMGLYSHIARKDDLIDLMIDRIAGDFLLETIAGDWREALREIARGTRAACLRHPWVVAAIERRPVFGPNGIRHLEQSLAAVAGLELELGLSLRILRVVDKFTLGQVIDELSQQEMLRRESLTEVEWQRSATGYIEGLIATGEFPQLARAGAGALFADRDPERAFETGLDWLLNGIAASL